MRPSAAGIACLLVSMIVSETFIPFSNAHAQTAVPPEPATSSPAPAALEIAQADSTANPPASIPPPATQTPPPSPPPAAAPPPPAAQTPPATTTSPATPPAQLPPPKTLPVQTPTTPPATPPPATPPATAPPPAPAPVLAPAFDWLVSLGVNYAWASGSELEKVNPSIGARATVAMNVFSHVSACGSLAYNSNSVDGQVVQLMDRYVRPDRRSGNVIGDVKFFRLGLGVRVDAASTEDWKYRPYFQAEVLYAQTELNLDSVDGNPPAPGIVPFSQWKMGALGRAGMDFGLTPNFGIETFFAYEILEFPAGSMFLASLQAGGTYRF